MAEGRAVNKRTKSLTPVRTKKLLNSWRTKKVKLYKDGKVRVVRVQSTAPHAHLIELGHKIVSGGRTPVSYTHLSLSVGTAYGNCGYRELQANVQEKQNGLLFDR